MYRGFNLKHNINNKSSIYNKSNFESNRIFTAANTKIGRNLYETQKVNMRAKLKGYAISEDIIDGAELESDWFPEVDAHIFISHSHNDEDDALALAGWLYSIFNIRSFIDSCVWGYADDLLYIIDKENCVSERDRNGNIVTFNYQDRNRSTSHVHMILATALQKMIYKTECLIFMNTPNSLSLTEVMKQEATASPWIYNELSFSKMVEKIIPDRHRTGKAQDSVLTESKRYQIAYKLTMDHLYDLDEGDLLLIKQRVAGKGPFRFLDELYTYSSIQNDPVGVKIK